MCENTLDARIKSAGTTDTVSDPKIASNVVAVVADSPSYVVNHTNIPGEFRTEYELFRRLVGLGAQSCTKRSTKCVVSRSTVTRRNGCHKPGRIQSTAKRDARVCKVSQIGSRCCALLGSLSVSEISIVDAEVNDITNKEPPVSGNVHGRLDAHLYRDIVLCCLPLRPIQPKD